MNFEQFKEQSEKQPVAYYPKNVPVNPLVSVCVTTYNHEGYINDCIENILNQKTDFDFELVIGEDSSTDGTQAICKEYAEKHPDKVRLYIRSREHVILIDGRPSGRYNFMETIKAAKGKYIALCDGDDYWIDEYKLQKQIDFMAENPDVVLVGTNAQIGVEESENNKKRYNLIPKNKLSFDDFIKYRAILMTSTIMFKNRHSWEFPEWSKHSGGGDWNLFLMLTQEGGNAYILDKEITTFHRIHAGGVYSGTSMYYRNYKKLLHYYVLLKNFNQEKKILKSRIAVFELKCLRSSLKKFDIVKALKHGLSFARFSIWFRPQYLKDSTSFSSKVLS